MNVRNMFVAPVLIPLAACASIATGTDQPINVSSYPVDGARCVIESPTGEKWAVTTPGAVNVPKTKHDLTATCTKEAEYSGQRVIASEVEPWVFGNIILGGLIGAGIDWATGAIHQYPDSLSINMAPTGAQPAATPQSTEESGEPQS